MDIHKLRILGSGFTEEEYELYRFDLLQDPNDAMRFLSHRLNNRIYRPKINYSIQKHFLEDKWVVQQFFSSVGIPVAKTYGLYHPQFGVTINGTPMTNYREILQELTPFIPLRLVLKPRGGRKGRNIIVTNIFFSGDNQVLASLDDQNITFKDFINTLPSDAFGDYDGSYYGWLIQDFIQQHKFMNYLNPYTVNTIRMVTFLNSNNECQIHFSALRLGRKGSTADNWDKGGISVCVDLDNGKLGKGVFKPKYGGGWVSKHPDTGVVFEGEKIPDWENILDICKRAAKLLSGIRSVGWDIVLTPDGPLILEGNAEWGLPVVQVHSKGYLTDQIRQELSDMGACFPKVLKPFPLALIILIYRQWQRSRGPLIINKLIHLMKADNQV